MSQSLCLALALSDRTVHSVTLTVPCCIVLCTATNLLILFKCSRYIAVFVTGFVKFKLYYISQNCDSNTIGYSKVFIAHNKAVRKAYSSDVLLNLSTFLYLPTSSRRPTVAVNSRIWSVFILRPAGSVD
jgi:hypothetical protein